MQGCPLLAAEGTVHPWCGSKNLGTGQPGLGSMLTGPAPIGAARCGGQGVGSGARLPGFIPATHRPAAPSRLPQDLHLQNSAGPSSHLWTLGRLTRVTAPEGLGTAPGTAVLLILLSQSRFPTGNLFLYSARNETSSFFASPCERDTEAPRGE